MRWVIGVYAMLVLAATAYPFFADGPEAGVFAVVLTAPWSVLFVVLADALAPGLLDSPAALAMPLAGGAGNVLLLRLLLGRRTRRGE